MNGLSLCAGVGGLDLGVEIAFPAYRTIAAVENNPEAARRFRLRFPQAKVFRDVVGFDGRPLNGILDCVVAGWPCQPHSVAGKRLGTADERWIWSDIARILDETGAPLFFGENVSGLLRDANGASGSDLECGDSELDDDAADALGGMGTVLRDLAALGFVSAWGSLRASQVRASHGRPRVFVLAVRRGVLLEHSTNDHRRRGIGGTEAGVGENGVGRRGSAGAGDYLDTFGMFAPGPSDPAWLDILAASPHLAPALSPVTAALAIALQEGRLDLQAEVESGFCGLADGVARWLVERRPRLQCGGNGVVPLQAAVAFTVLAWRLGLTPETLRRSF